MFKAKVILDSINSDGNRLTSIELTYPRFIHAEFMTHRDRARNAASSRAIPWKAKGPKCTIKEMPEGAIPIGKDIFDEISLNPFETYEYYKPNCMYAMIRRNPVVPLSFDGEQKGMQSAGPIKDQDEATKIWLEARSNALLAADRLANLGVHKSICNRLVEPFMWMTVLCTATEWKNFFRLRCHPAAEKHFQKIAWMCREALNNSKPTPIDKGGWHMPYIDWEDQILIAQDYRNRALEVTKKVSAARCARLSYLTQDGKRDIEEDLKLAERLIRPPGDIDEEVMHASPFEHVAQAATKQDRSGPFKGWLQYRKEFPNENVEG